MAYHSADGTRRTSNLPMNTQDGLVWTLETSVIESRQHPINSIVYNYQVEDGD
jgi:4-alpha-glucanotransferase